MNSQTQKIVNFISICRKAGKLVIGFDSVKESIIDKKALLVLTASDISDKTLKEISFICEKGDVTLKTVEATKNEIWYILGKQAGVIAVCDKGFSDKFIELLNTSKN